MKKCMFFVIAMLAIASLAFAQPAKHHSFGGLKHGFTKQEVVDASIGRNNLILFSDVWKQELVNVFSWQDKNLGWSRSAPPVEAIPLILNKCDVRLIPSGTILTGYVSNDGTTGYWERPVLKNEYGLYYEDTVDGKKATFLLMSLYCTNPVYQVAVIEDVSVVLSEEPVAMSFSDAYVQSALPVVIDSDGDGISDPFDTDPGSGFQNKPASKSSVVRMGNLPEASYDVLLVNTRSSQKSGFKKNWPYYVGSAILIGAGTYMLASAQSRKNQSPPPPRIPTGPTGPAGDPGNGDPGNPNGDPGNGNPDPNDPGGPAGDDGHGGRPGGYNPPRVFMIGFSRSF